jgi:hypothetical protein
MSQVSEDINKTESRYYLNFDTCPEMSQHGPRRKNLNERLFNIDRWRASHLELRPSAAPK